MNVLIACEFSGVVRDAFTKRGHYAVSCDLLPSEREGNHYQGDVRDILDGSWDLMIAHPPCTYLSKAGLHYSKKNPERMRLTEKAVDFFMLLHDALISKKCIENPAGWINTKYRKPDQIINPFNFGTPERKETCLWLIGLPLLKITHNVPPKPKGSIIRKSGAKKGQVYNYYWRAGKSCHDRSRTFQCIADAMAEQWG